jgi:hypothetical protein
MIALRTESIGPEARLVLDSAEWAHGYEDGAAGKPGKAGQSHSYYSGWIEGDARGAQNRRAALTYKLAFRSAGGLQEWL